MYKVYSYEEFQEAMKKTKFKRWLNNKKVDILVWINNNKEIITVFLPAAVGITLKTIRAINRQQRVKKEQDLKDLYCYDRSLGHYWRLKRELSNKEWIEIDRRKKSGERLADILSELKLLK